MRKQNYTIQSTNEISTIYYIQHLVPLSSREHWSFELDMRIESDILRYLRLVRVVQLVRSVCSRTVIKPLAALITSGRGRQGYDRGRSPTIEVPGWEISPEQPLQEGRKDYSIEARVNDSPVVTYRRVQTVSGIRIFVSCRIQGVVSHRQYCCGASKTHTCHSPSATSLSESLRIDQVTSHRSSDTVNGIGIFETCLIQGVVSHRQYCCGASKRDSGDTCHSPSVTSFSEDHLGLPARRLDHRLPYLLQSSTLNQDWNQGFPGYKLRSIDNQTPCLQSPIFLR